jgi:hypothetical protein
MASLAASAITGGCQCGACRYTISGLPPPVYACHCLECQHQSASAFGLSMPVDRGRLNLTGETACYTRRTDSGRLTDCHFCVRCGTRLYHQSQGNPEFVTVKGGTLDDTHTLRPVAHIWVSRKQPWVVLDPAVPNYETQPSNLEEWRAMVTGAGYDE